MSRYNGSARVINPRTFLGQSLKNNKVKQTSTSRGHIVLIHTKLTKIATTTFFAVAIRRKGNLY